MRSKATPTSDLARATAGSPEAFERLLSACRPSILRQLSQGAHVGSIQVDDVFQEVAIELWQALPRLTNESEVFGYAGVVARRAAAKDRRRSGRYGDFFTPTWVDLQRIESEPHEDVVADRQLVNWVAEQLEPADRHILISHLVEGIPLRNLASDLEVNTRTVNRRFRRSLLRARELFSDQGVPLHHALLAPDQQTLEPDSNEALEIALRVQEVSDELLRLMRDDPTLLHRTDPRHFEMIVAELLDRQGFQVTLTAPSADGGRDIHVVQQATLGSFLYFVECKRYAPDRPVGVEIVRSLHGVVDAERATAGLVVTSSRFTAGAREFESKVPHRMALKDFTDLKAWLNSDDSH